MTAYDAAAAAAYDDAAYEAAEAALAAYDAYKVELARINKEYPM